MSGFAPVSAGVVAWSFAVVAVLRVVGRIGCDGSGRQSGGNEGGPREISKKKVRTGGEAGVDASPREVSGAHRLEAGHRTGRHAALVVSRNRCDAPDALFGGRSAL